MPIAVFFPQILFFTLLWPPKAAMPVGDIRLSDQRRAAMP
jgi:hypothetical protein